MPPRHQFIGFINPRCTTCGKTPMQVQRDPVALCRRYTLPFDEEQPRPVKVPSPERKEHAR